MKLPVLVVAGALGLLAATLMQVAQAAPQTALQDALPQTIEFNRDIRPILSDNDHTRLTFRYQGRHFRLTDVFGKVVQKALTFDAGT